MINLDSLNKKISTIFGGENLLQKEKVAQPQFYMIADLLPYRFFDEEKKVFINDNSAGFILEAPPLIGADESVIDTLSGMFSDGIPEGCTIQFLNWASPKIQPIFEKWQEPRNAVGGVYKKLAQKRVEYFKKANHQSIFDSSPFTLKNFRLIVSVSLAFKDHGSSVNVTEKISDLLTQKSTGAGKLETINQLNAFKEKFITALRTAGLISHEMNQENLINFIDEIINFNISPHKITQKYDPLQPINKQIVDQENHLQVEADQIKLFADNEEKKTSVRCFSVRNFPSNWAQWECKNLIGDFYQDLRRMEYPFLTAFSVTLPRNEEALRSKAKQKNFNATRLQGSEIAKFIPEMRTAASEWQFVTQKINAGQRILKTFYQVLAFAPENKIEEAEQTLKSIYKASGWDIVRDKHLNMQSFLAALPFTQSEGLFVDLEKFNRTRTMVSWTCANLAPLQGEWNGMDSPCMMLFGRRGQPLFWNPFKNTEGNYNVAVIGKSGSGKSVCLQEIVASILGLGGKVYVIDDGRSFMNSCLLQDGEFIEFSDKSEICINPFSVVNEKVMEEKPEYKSEVISLIKSMIRQMCEGQAGTEKISNVQDRYIEEAVQLTWAEYGSKASISVVRDYFKKHEDPRGKDLAILIQPFTKDGIYGRFFEGKSNIKLDNRFMVFELAELKNKKEFQAIVLMFLMFLVSENMYFGDRKTPISLLIDEAWDLLHGEGSKTFIEGLARRARKYCGNIITGTQSVNDYYKTPATIAAFENTDWILLLAQKKESIEQLSTSGRIIMDDGMKQTLNSVRMVDHQYSEILIYGPRGYAVGRLILDPYSIALYSSKAQDFAKIQELRGQGYSLPDALEIIADAKLKDKKVSFFTAEDYKQLLFLTENKENPFSFEEALEQITKLKLQKNFPQMVTNFYESKIK